MTSQTKKKNESLNELSMQIANLRKCRDGLIPYSTESLRQAKQSILTPILSSNEKENTGNEMRLRRKRVKSSTEEEEQVGVEGLEEEIDDTKREKNSNENRRSNPMVEIHSSAQYSRMTAISRLLMETLEEQGALRALLQHTSKENDPSVVNFDNFNQPGLQSNFELRYRGTLLELEKTVQKLIQMKTEYEDEKQKRVSLERALQIATKNLEETNMKLEETKSELKEWKKGRMREEQYRHSSSTKEMKPRYENPPQEFLPPPPPPPPLPPPPSESSTEEEEQEEEVEEQEEEEEKDQEVNRIQNNRAASPPPSSRSQPQPQQPQHQSPSSPIHERPHPIPSIMLDIDLGDGKKGIIDVTIVSNPVELAYQFLYQHALNPDYVYPLIDYITKTKVALEEEQNKNNSSFRKNKRSDEKKEQKREFSENIPLESMSSPPPSSGSRSLPVSGAGSGPSSGPFPDSGPNHQEKISPTNKKNFNKNNSEDLEKIEQLRVMLENGEISSPDELLHYLSRLPGGSTTVPSTSREGELTHQQSSSSSIAPPSPPHSASPSTAAAASASASGSSPKSRRSPSSKTTGTLVANDHFPLPPSPTESPSFDSSNHSSRERNEDSPSESSESSLLFQDLPPETPLSPPPLKGRHSSQEQEEEELIVTPLSDRSERTNSSYRSSNLSGNGTFDLSMTINESRGGGGGGERGGGGQGETTLTSQENDGVMKMNFMNQKRQETSPPFTHLMLEKPKRRYPPRQDLLNDSLPSNRNQLPPPLIPSRDQLELDYYDPSDDLETSENNSDSEIASQDLQETNYEEDSYRLDEEGEGREEGEREEEEEEDQLENYNKFIQKKQNEQMKFQEKSSQEELFHYSRSRYENPSYPAHVPPQAQAQPSAQDQAQDRQPRDESMKTIKTIRVNQHMQHEVIQRNQINDHMRRSSNSSSRTHQSLHSLKTSQPIREGGNNSHLYQRGGRKEIVEELSIRAENVDPLEVAIEVFDSATTLANEGNLEDAIPLYLHALKIFEEFNYEELPMIREEIWKWVSLADQATSIQTKRSSRPPSPNTFHSSGLEMATPSNETTNTTTPMSLSEIKSPKRRNSQQNIQTMERKKAVDTFPPPHGPPPPSLSPPPLPLSGPSQQEQQPQQQQGTNETLRRKSVRMPSIDML